MAHPQRGRLPMFELGRQLRYYRYTHQRDNRGGREVPHGPINFKSDGWGRFRRHPVRRSLLSCPSDRR